MLCGEFGFVLQNDVLRSPQVRIGAYAFPVEYKGVTLFLDRSLYRSWTFLEHTFPIVWILTAVLTAAAALWESRIKKARWEADLAEIFERSDADGGK